MNLYVMKWSVSIEKYVVFQYKFCLDYQREMFLARIGFDMLVFFHTTVFTMNLFKIESTQNWQKNLISSYINNKSLLKHLEK